MTMYKFRVFLIGVLMRALVTPLLADTQIERETYEGVVTFRRTGESYFFCSCDGWARLALFTRLHGSRPKGRRYCAQPRRDVGNALWQLYDAFL